MRRCSLLSVFLFSLVFACVGVTADVHQPLRRTTLGGAEHSLHLADAAGSSSTGGGGGANWVPRSPFPNGATRSDYALSQDSAHRFAYISGGCSGAKQFSNSSCPQITTDVLRYEFATDSWATMASLPTGQPRYRHNSVLLSDSRLVIAGGRNLDKDAITCDVVIINVNSGTVQPFPPAAPTDRQCRSDAAMFVLGSKVYLVGGYTADYSPMKQEDINLVWDVSKSPNTPVWESGPTWPAEVASVGDIGAAVVNGVAYVVGGFTPMADGTYQASSSIAAFNGIKWSRAWPLSLARGDMGVVDLGDNLIVLGGEQYTANSPPTPVANVERMNTRTGSKDALLDLAEDRFRFHAASSGSCIYEFGGQSKLRTDATGQYFALLGAVRRLNVSDPNNPIVPNSAPAPFSNLAVAHVTALTLLAVGVVHWLFA